MNIYALRKHITQYAQDTNDIERAMIAYDTIIGNHSQDDAYSTVVRLSIPQKLDLLRVLLPASEHVSLFASAYAKIGETRDKRVALASKYTGDALYVIADTARLSIWYADNDYNVSARHIELSINQMLKNTLI